MNLHFYFICGIQSTTYPGNFLGLTEMQGDAKGTAGNHVENFFQYTGEILPQV